MEVNQEPDSSDEEPRRSSSPNLSPENLPDTTDPIPIDTLSLDPQPLTQDRVTNKERFDWFFRENHKKLIVLSKDQFLSRYEHEELVRYYKVVIVDEQPAAYVYFDNPVFWTSDSLEEVWFRNYSLSPASLVPFVPVLEVFAEMSASLADLASLKATVEKLQKQLKEKKSGGGLKAAKPQLYDGKQDQADTFLQELKKSHTSHCP